MTTNNIIQFPKGGDSPTKKTAIKARLSELNKTQGWLAKRCGISARRMNDYATGKAALTPNHPVTLAIKKHLALSLDELVRDRNG